MEIKYDLLQINGSSSECETIATTVVYNETDVLEENSSNFGKVKNKVDEIIQDMSVCAKNTQEYFTNMSSFIKEMAEYLEKTDKDIARRIEED